MNEFVEQCRHEWRRLGVPDATADEMAADLASDLAEAHAEGRSVREYLGEAADDPRGFAATWAAERGIVPAPSLRRRPRLLVAFGALSLLMLIVAAVLLATGEPRLELVGLRQGAPGVTARQVLQATSAAAPVEWILLALALAGTLFAARLWTSWHRDGSSPEPTRG